MCPINFENDSAMPITQHYEVHSESRHRVVATLGCWSRIPMQQNLGQKCGKGFVGIGLDYFQSDRCEW